VRHVHLRHLGELSIPRCVESETKNLVIIGEIGAVVGIQSLEGSQTSPGGKLVSLSPTVPGASVENRRVWGPIPPGTVVVVWCWRIAAS